MLMIIIILPRFANFLKMPKRSKRRAVRHLSCT